ncbi:MAG: sensor histidine kinase, partial [Hyphomicrobiaceae bacterium]|nr:sensor histidine kinase [Hyphomicrobiaceae bacterium]
MGDQFETHGAPLWDKLVKKTSEFQDSRLALAFGHAHKRMSPLLRYFKLNYKFTSLTTRILAYNLLGLITLIGGLLILNQYRAGLIEVRVQNLLTQGKIIAEAIAQSSSLNTDQVIVDPESLLEMQSDHDILGAIESYDSLDFPINPERAAPILLGLVAPTRTRARIYDHDGVKLLDSQTLNARGQISRKILPAPGEFKSTYSFEFTRWVKRMWRGNIPLYQDIGGANGRAYQEVKSALAGHPGKMSRLNERSELIVSVAVPIQRMQAVLGVLMLSTKGDDIDKIVAAELWGISRIGAIAAIVMAALSMWLSNQIGAPMRKLAAAARRVRHSAKAREEIPDFTWRTDEIGELSLALRNMTGALYSRIEAIETFAADVAHELKNPLTSLKSAVETLPLVQKEELRERLTKIILHDVKRLDRLISDISSASRLDAELSREEMSDVNIANLLHHLRDAYKKPMDRMENIDESKHTSDRDSKITVTIPSNIKTIVRGNEDRLAQVFGNLISNALSFSPENDSVHIMVKNNSDTITVSVEDDGPGIPESKIETIFERFYTERPDHEDYGNHSGLGLSISKQIIDAHDGNIWAE